LASKIPIKGSRLEKEKKKMDRNLKLPVGISYAAAVVFVFCAWQYTHNWAATESSRLFGDLCWILATGILVGALVSHGNFTKPWSQALSEPWGVHRFTVSQVTGRRAKVVSVALLLALFADKLGVRLVLRQVVKILELLGVRRVLLAVKNALTPFCDFVLRPWQSLLALGVLYRTRTEPAPVLCTHRRRGVVEFQPTVPIRLKSPTPSVSKVRLSHAVKRWVPVRPHSQTAITKRFGPGATVIDFTAMAASIVLYALASYL
jgi:hypothetical protein